MARVGIVKPKAGNSGKSVPANKVPKPTKLARSAVRKPTPNLSATYGVQGSNRINVNAPGGLKGAVTQGKPANKFSKAAAKAKIQNG